MFKNYLKTAWRNLEKNKTFSFINIFGLTIGLTSFLLIALYIFDELTYDRFHKNANNIYRLVDQRISAEGKERKIAGAGYQVAERAKTENTNVFYDDFWLSNSGFLETFDFELLQGNRHTALTAPHSVVVTEETAIKLFNTINVLDKTIIAGGDSIPFKVTGVLKKIPYRK